MTVTTFSSMKDLVTYLDVMENRIVALESENHLLKDHINALRQENLDFDTIFRQHLPKTNLLNPSYIRRAFAVWGHYFVAQLIISIPIIVIYLIILLAAFSNALGGGG